MKYLDLIRATKFVTGHGSNILAFLLLKALK